MRQQSLFGDEPTDADVGKGALYYTSIGTCIGGECWMYNEATGKCNLNPGIMGDGTCILHGLVWEDEAPGTCVECAHRVTEWQCEAWPGAYSILDKPAWKTCERWRKR